ncbi:putative gustatory receptor 28b [Prorops nasuta]|uniref:putative gustatory receptor 28b n=1 Tax=Prorops nasuta TaxID=863751 RepID=UPI0034CF3946
MTAVTRTLKEGLSPLLWLHWIYGLGIIEFPLNHSRIAITIAYILTVRAFVFYIYFFTLLKTASVRLQNFEKCSSFALVGINLIAAFIDTVLGLYKSQELKNVLARCELVDETLGRFNVEKHYAEVKKRSKRWLIAWLFFVLLFIALKTHQLQQDLTILDAFIRTLILSQPIQVHSAVDVTFLALLEYVKSRFISINYVIEETFEKESMNTESIRKCEGKCRKIFVARKNVFKYRAEHVIQTVRQLHLELRRITRKINAIFHMQILLQLACYFCQVLTALFQLYFLSGMSKSHARNSISLAWMVIWLSVYCLKLLGMNHLCGAVAFESREINRIIQEIKHSSYNTDVKEEIQQFCLQILLCPLNLTASGWFELNNNLTGSFFDKAATYLVMLLQVTNSSNMLHHI